MGRPQKARKRRYKSYYDIDGEDDEIPESTLRYQKRSKQGSPNASMNPTQTCNSSFVVIDDSSGCHNPDNEERMVHNPQFSSSPDNAPVAQAARREQEGHLLVDGDMDSQQDYEEETAEKSDSQSTISSVFSPSEETESMSDNRERPVSSRSCETVQEVQQCQQRPSLFVDNDVDSQEAYEEESLNSECTNPSVSACSAGMDNHSDDRQQPAGRNCQIVQREHCHSFPNNEEPCQHDIFEENMPSESSVQTTEVYSDESQGNSSAEESSVKDSSGSEDSSESSSDRTDQRHEDNDSQQDSDGDDLPDEDLADRAILQDPFKRLKSGLEGPFRERMNLTVNISVGEILTNALTLVKKHNWSHLEKEHLMKFTTSILTNGNVVPNSRFLLDEHFYSMADMWYYFFCSNCSKSLGDVSPKRPRPSQVICSICDTVNILSDLSQATFFVKFYLPSQIEVLLSDCDIRRKLVSPSDFVNTPTDNIMTDLYHGTCYREFAKHVEPECLSNTKVMSFTLSVDSAALCSFSGQSICPCFVMLNELPPVLRMGNPLLAGLWFGLVKEKMDLFLPPIVDHIKDLSMKGFKLNFDEEIWDSKAYLIACCADSVARCDIQGIHSHRGDFPCSWCLEEGEEGDNNNRIFRYGPLAPPRTLEELIVDAREALQTRTFVNGVKYMSPLAPAPLFHAVDGFIVDQMHAKDEGTTKSFLHAWLGIGETVEKDEEKPPYNIKSEKNISKINSILKKLKLPKECRKNVRDLKDLAYWTGRELENFGLFISIPVMYTILPKKYVIHWALYVQAIYILLNTEIPLPAVQIASDLIEEFCSQVEELYNSRMMRFNLHILRHFPGNSKRWGPIFALSAYGPEAGNQKLKKLVHNCNYIPNQVCRGLSEEKALFILRKFCSSAITKSFEDAIDHKKCTSPIELPGKIRLLQKGKSFNPTQEEDWFIRRMGKESSNFVLYGMLQKDGCHYGATLHRNKTKTDNSFARLQNKQIIKIRKILYHEMSNETWIVGSPVRCRPSQFCPRAVVDFDPNLCFQYVVSSIDEDILFYDVSDLKTVCVSMQLDHGHYLSPMPNIFNMY